MTPEECILFRSALDIAHFGSSIRARRAAMRRVLDLLGACAGGKRRAMNPAHKSWSDAWNAASANDLHWFVANRALALFDSSDPLKAARYRGALEVVSVLARRQTPARRAALYRRVFTSQGVIC